MLPSLEYQKKKGPVMVSGYARAYEEHAIREAVNPILGLYIEYIYMYECVCQYIYAYS